MKRLGGWALAGLCLAGARLWADESGTVRLEQRWNAAGLTEEARDDDGDGRVDVYSRGSGSVLSLRLRGWDADRIARADDPQP